MALRQSPSLTQSLSRSLSLILSLPDKVQPSEWLLYVTTKKTDYAPKKFKIWLFQYLTEAVYP